MKNEGGGHLDVVPEDNQHPSTVSSTLGEGRDIEQGVNNSGVLGREGAIVNVICERSQPNNFQQATFEHHHGTDVSSAVTKVSLGTGEMKVTCSVGANSSFCLYSVSTKQLMRLYIVTMKYILQ